MSSEKKRKRSSAAGAVSGSVKIIAAESSDLPPVVASTSGIELPPISFKPYTRAALDGSKKKRTRSEYLLHGSNPRLDYEAREVEDDAQLNRYYVGVFDPATNSVQLHVAPKVVVTAAIKKHRQRDLEVQARGSAFTFAESRVALGKAFGTRKAQSALTSREINKVDVSEMEASVSKAVVSQIEESTRDMPSTADLGRAMMDERPVPKHNAAATKASEVYKREDLISDEEWENLWISDWVKSGEVNTRSSHVNIRAARLLSDTGKGHTRELKILKYLSSLIDFYLFANKSRGRVPPLAKAKMQLKATPPVVLDAFYARFTETTSGEAKKGEDGIVRDGDKQSVSPRLELKILTHIAVLALMADNYDVDVYDLKNDLNILPRELAQAFKEVGCSIKELGKLQIETSKFTKVEASQHKRAVLKIPLEFPPPPRKRAAQGGRR